MPIAIAKHDTCFASGRLSLVLLRALHTVAARGIESETAVSLRAACQVLHEAVLQHRRARSECEKCMRLQSEFSVLINEEYRRHSADATSARHAGQRARRLSLFLG